MKKKLRSNRFQRPVGTRALKKVFYIFTEGSETEPRYFDIFRTDKYPNISIQIKKHPTKSHPKQILERAKKFLKGESLKKGDQVWLVVDHDERPEADFQPLIQWSDGKKYFFAISKPFFELWLLLHFDEAHKIKTKKECIEKLKKYMLFYKKSEINRKKLEENLEKAIKNGKNRFRLAGTDGVYTKVYELIESIIDTNNSVQKSKNRRGSYEKKSP